MTRRIVYMFALACSIAFNALYPYWIAWYLVVVVLMLAPFDLLISMPGMLTKRVSIHTPGILDQGADAALVITTYQKRMFPAGRIKVKLASIGEDFTTRRRIMCDPEDGSKYEVLIITSHSGLTVFEVKRIHNTSLIGLFSISISINHRAVVMVLPAPKKPPHIVSLPRGVILRPKPGGGFSEDHDLRPYRKGDPIRAIHWKLSAKYDSLIVREPLVPPNHSRLVHIMKWSGPQERDTILGRLRWISDYLLKWELPFFVRLGDNGPIAEITCKEDFLGYLYRMLDKDAPRSMPPVIDLPTRFTWVFRVDAKEGALE